MKKNNVIHLDAAYMRWNKIPKSVQMRILDTVWCGGCTTTTTLILESVKIQQQDLILQGKCKACAHEVCRIVEG
jgi:fluoride ion exporter CrcB/FEX